LILEIDVNAPPINRLATHDEAIATARAFAARIGVAIDLARERATAEAIAEASVEVAEAKVATTEAALQTASTLFELGGARSTLVEYNLDRHWRNARTHTLHDPVRWKYHIVGDFILNATAPPFHGAI
jgi:alkylation response protein AidB-like acyl-CoA dehydrogenase